ncbi:MULTISPECIES: hypothetical protein [unclassified Bradyrhizobium]|uniref:hypothetical protein n=1 Tax=unclassified Bradyrhizobium TaxID=2631580 RepID=UPI0029164A4E|nr:MULTISPECIES: hypothetical protein [unclassified Bradyrhizobium]
MPKFSVYGVVTGTKYLGTYDAPTKEAAIKMAEGEAHCSLCHQCSQECESPEVDEIRAEKVED